MRFVPFFLLISVLSACARPRPPAGPVADPLASLQVAPDPWVYKGSLSLTIQAPRWKLAGTVPATLVIRRPDHLFLQVRGPMGGTLLEALALPDGLSLLLPGKSLRVTSPDPDAALQKLTGGALGVDALLSLLEARLPRGHFDILDRIAEGRTARWTLAAPAGHRVRVETDARSGALLSVGVTDDKGVDLVDVAWKGRIRQDRKILPEDVSVRVPSLELAVDLHFRAWEVLGDMPGVFQPRALPPGFEEKTLDEVLAPPKEEEVATPPTP